ncbi:NYN domain-containing protein [Helicobacter felis]|uniref:NYN domain-containing protein n=1 Tax=Helicobacter felis TaxID=214 RepID=UPI001F29CF44|nr:NYN domain-containing protein [Helicobacter felis]
MKIGLDIASLATTIKKQVEKIILIANDSGFVSTIKFAEQDRVIVQLDPLIRDVSEDLSPHIDLLRFCINLRLRAIEKPFKTSLS